MKAIVLLATLLLAVPVSAQESDRCALDGLFSMSVMRLRQGDMPMSSMMAMVDPGPTKPATVEMIKAAYTVPRAITEAGRRLAVIEFRNAVELACYTRND